MKGIQHIEVFNRKVKYKFDLVRNITIISGNSGSGKTTLYNTLITLVYRQKAVST